MTTVLDEFDTIWAPPNKAVDDKGAVHDTVQNAVDNTDSTVLVGTGTFNESVTITTDGVELRGVGDNCVIDGGTTGHAIEINGAGNVTISSIGAKTDSGGGNNFDAINVTGTSPSRCDLVDVRIESSDRHGIAVQSGSRIVISRCRIGQNVDTHGILLSGGAEHGVYSTRVDACGADGIHVNDTQVKVVGCLVFDNASDGIQLDGNDCVVAATEMKGNGANGVAMLGTDQLVVGNVYSGNTGSDIDTSGATNPTVMEDSPFELGNTTVYADSTVKSGSVTLASGSATIDTGVSEATTATFMVAIGPTTDGADVAADVRAVAAGNYEVDIQETDTSVGNPTVEFDIIRVR